MDLTFRNYSKWIRIILLAQNKRTFHNNLIRCKSSHKSESPALGDKGPITLTRFVLSEQRKIPGATGDLSTILTSLQVAAKATSSAVRKAGFTKLFGATQLTNVQGERVKKLDVLANDLFINLLQSSFKCSVLVSEENQDIIPIKVGSQGRYAICFDPLDGSSNIDCLASIGSIFAIYRKEKESEPSIQEVLKPGKEMVAAGYVVYGSATMMVLSTGSGVNGFMLHPGVGEFILTDPNMKVPKKGHIYSVNAGYLNMYRPAIKEYIAAKQAGDKDGKPYSARYIGSLVADVHRTIKYGGIFLYPETKISPRGKLRLLYECNPMAFIIEQAGGVASNGEKRVLDIKPSDIHERCPLYLGSKNDVDEFLSYMQKHRE